VGDPSKTPRYGDIIYLALVTPITVVLLVFGQTWSLGAFALCLALFFGAVRTIRRRGT
jgi:hypothetical protein